MAIAPLHHLAFKVECIDRAVAALTAIGWQAERIETYPDLSLRIAFVPCGAVVLELLQALDPSCPVSSDPLGFHHLAVSAQADASQAPPPEGLRPLGPARQGAHGFPIRFFELPLGAKNPLRVEQVYHLIHAKDSPPHPTLSASSSGGAPCLDPSKSPQ